MATSITIGHPSFSAFKPYLRLANQTIDNTTSNDATTYITANLDKSLASVNVTSTTRRRQRTTFTSVQADTLEKEYLTDQYMPRSRRLLIARSLGLNESQVKTWFQNRRAKDKRNDKNATLLRHTTSSNASSPPDSSPEVNENNSALIQHLCSKTFNQMQLTLR
ncbi:Hypothetical homeobox protein R06F6.6 in chromosome II, putative [Brugia malayi]|uniref:Hypothetical homeobox protein R06F6.6 in chromosome II, putative n=1 Tax=Brugia malayi TaxID=6279 RepID=A0A0J9XWS2_BRUMA|nr:putative homeobox protein R06F6.6 in chromosome II, putative [Brugia malayi]CDP97324.1 BMA-CEH-62, isoform b [Brugia malayi]VIO92867.1 Hypothetical homeobox protein R06F6.6 in chromosome II, putative [Brugia malayi]